MILNCIVVDDSSIQRMIITKLIENQSNLRLIGAFSNAIEARTCVSKNKIDLIFLDIEMPVLNGFELLDAIKVKPQIIFITAKTEYAVKAFDYNATDYMQKPITVERFTTSLKKAIQIHLTKVEIQDDDSEDDFIFIKSNLKQIKIFTARIKWIEAFGDYVKVVTDHTSNLVLSTMKSFEKDLDKNKFMRIHKSYIVNLDRVKSFNSKFVDIEDTLIPLSRNKKEEVSNVLASKNQESAVP